MADEEIKIELEKHFEKIKRVYEAGGFDICNGHCEIHYDKYNNISDVVIVKHNRL
jgi:hypothetical protein